jgi:hypothetical protein
VIVFAPGRSAAPSVIALADGQLLRSGFGFATGTSDRAGVVRRLSRRAPGSCGHRSRAVDENVGVDQDHLKPSPSI